jgi:NADH dehydrogenase FAD-containing subunit
VDTHLRVAGSNGTIFCIGDAASASGASGPLPPTAQVRRRAPRRRATRTKRRLRCRHHCCCRLATIITPNLLTALSPRRPLQPLPPLPKVARQQGEYLARLLSRGLITANDPPPPSGASGAAAGGEGEAVVAVAKGTKPFRCAPRSGRRRAAPSCFPHTTAGAPQHLEPKLAAASCPSP